MASLRANDQRRSGSGPASSGTSWSHVVVRGTSPGRDPASQASKKSVASRWLTNRNEFISTQRRTMLPAYAPYHREHAAKTVFGNFFGSRAGRIRLAFHDRPHKSHAGRCRPTEVLASSRLARTRSADAEPVVGDEPKRNRDRRRPGKCRPNMPRREAGRIASRQFTIRSTGDSPSPAPCGIHGVYFPATLAPMLAAAEASGDVPETLGRVCQRMRGELQMRGTIFGAMIYPAILIGASSVVMCALILGVLPQFSKVFASTGRPVPVYTQVLLSFGDFCGAYWIGILPAVVGSLIALVDASAARDHSATAAAIFDVRSADPRCLSTASSRASLANHRFHGPGWRATTAGGAVLAGHHRVTFIGKVCLPASKRILIDGLTASSAMLDVEFIPPGDGAVDGHGGAHRPGRRCSGGYRRASTRKRRSVASNASLWLWNPRSSL